VTDSGAPVLHNAYLYGIGVGPHFLHTLCLRHNCYSTFNFVILD